MPGDVNTETNQTPKTINMPDESEGQGVENRPPADEPSDRGGETPEEHVPPVEIPGGKEEHEHVPEKNTNK